MSRIAAAVSDVMAEGWTRRNVPAGVSNVDTPSVVNKRYGVSSGPSGSSSVYVNGWSGSAITLTVSGRLRSVLLRSGPPASGALGTDRPFPCAPRSRTRARSPADRR